MHTDCRHFTGAVPCTFHKRDGRPCGDCSTYAPAERRLLIVKLAAAGDVLRTTSILPAMRRRWPNAQITWITDRRSVPLLTDNPLIDRVIAADAAPPRLLVERFDAAYGLDPDADGGALLAIARAEARFGFTLDERGTVVPVNRRAREWWELGLDDRRKRLNRRSYQSLMYDVCELDEPVHAPQFIVSAAARRAIDARLAAAGVNGGRMLLLNTGGGTRWEQKRWCPEHYVAFVAMLREREPGTVVVVAGGPEERDFTAHLLAPFSADPGVVDGGCNNSISEFAALIERAGFVVTSDSLALHLATALDRPLVAIVGPTSPWELDLFGRGEVITADVPCLACYQKTCDKPVTCMELLSPERVYEACVRVGRAGLNACATAG